MWQVRPPRRAHRFVNGSPASGSRAIRVVGPEAVKVNQGSLRGLEGHHQSREQYREMIMKTRLAGAAATAVALTLAFGPAVLPAQAAPERTVAVGGAPMYPSRNIIQNAVNSKDHTTLVAAVKAAGLVETLQGPGPFTVFAPANKAFQKLPAGTVESLLMAENKGLLTGVLTYHVVAGRYTAEDLMALVARNKGKAVLSTVEGQPLTVTQPSRRKLAITDVKGGQATVTIPDVLQSNGVIHVVDTVLLPS